MLWRLNGAINNARRDYVVLLLQHGHTEGMTTTTRAPVYPNRDKHSEQTGKNIRVVLCGDKEI